MTQGRRSGTEFGPYRLEELLGRGGMGEVYRAYDTGKDRYVALKLLDPALADDPSFQERFRRESQVAARLGEPHVIPIHDWGEIDGVLYLDMRLVVGDDLRTVLREEGALEPARAVGIIEQVAAAIDAAHADGLVHRDIKPENVLLADNDFAYLVDFGIAHGNDDTRLTQTGTAIGSIAYMAPELFDAAPITSSSDIYALTCVLYETLTGTVPHPASTVSAAIKAAVLDPIPVASQQNAAIPGGFDDVIRTGLAPDPAHRYATATDLAKAARAALSSDAATQVIGAATLHGNPDTDDAPSEASYAQTQIRSTDPSITGGPRVFTPLASRNNSSSAAAQPVSAPYPPPPGGGVQYAQPTGYPPPPGPYGPQPAYPQQRGGGSKALTTTLIAIAALLLIGLIILGVYWFLSERDSSSTSSTQTTPTLTQTVTPTQAAPAAPAAPPPGSAPCDATVGVGTAVTSCPFAQAVRAEYLRTGVKGQARTIVASSPVTGLSYTMSCVPEGAIVVCRGGNDAVVHIY